MPVTSALIEVHSIVPQNSYWALPKTNSQSVKSQNGLRLYWLVTRGQVNSPITIFF